MKTPLLSVHAPIFLVCALAMSAAAAGPALDTRAGPVQLHPVEHASFVMEWNDRTIYVDPVGPVSAYAEHGAADVLLLTHPHGDHLDTETLAGLDLDGATVIMPQSVADEIDGDFGADQRIMANGDTLSVAGMEVRAMPAYNLPPSEDAYHPKGWGNGYVLTLADKRVYISGDTEGIPAMRALEDIDLAFVCMNLPYTMDVDQAADAVADFEPAIVYPYHYRGQDVADFKRQVNERTDAVEVRLGDWYPE